MEQTLAQQHVRRSEANPATEVFEALVMPVLNAVTSSVVTAPVVSSLGLEALTFSTTTQEVASSFLYVQKQNEAFAAFSFDYVKASASGQTTRAEASLQLAA